MKNIYKLYFNHFTVNAILFGLITWSFDSFELSKPILIEMIIKSIIFSILLTWINVRTYLKDLKKRGLYNDQESFTVEFKNAFFSDTKIQEVLNKITQDAEFKEMSILQTKTGITIKTNMKWNSLGEIIDINFNDLNTENQNIEISSRPKSNLILIDNGKNKYNVDKITALIKNVA